MRPPVPLLVLCLFATCRTAPQGRALELFDGATLAGWRALGDARYSVDDGCILGEVGGGGQSFLVSERTFGDFVLELDVKNELPGNSGIQVRSRVRDDGRLQGYQIEIDPSPRAWSGGLYDEARRGWLDDLAGDDVARAAFRPGEWNRYRIECRGAWIRAWVNGVPTADHLDALDLEGVIGLQVHSGNDTRVRWRDLRLVDLGTRAWRDVPVSLPWARVHVEGDGRAARFVVRPDPARPKALEFRVDFGGEIRTLQRVVDALEDPEPIVLNVLWQDRRWAVHAEDLDTTWSGLLDSEQSARAEVALSVGAGHTILAAATLGPPER
ncbi:MAG TPA: DUF1080 domain-containing protein [Planctomycetota bacterium]|nr:DUF1080 domain-containing protein [Planctomycetota bacterium]